MKYNDFSSMPLVLDISDIADTLSIGKNKAYELVSTGMISSLRLGQKIRIPREEFVRFLREGTQRTA